MSKVYNLEQLRTLDVATLPKEEITPVLAQTMLKMKTLKAVHDDLDTQRKELYKLADSLVIGDNEEIKTPHGKYTKKDSDYMVLPTDEEGGKFAAVEWAISHHLNDGVPLDEAFQGFSVSLKASGWSHFETEDLPAGIGRATKKVVRFTPVKPK